LWLGDEALRLAQHEGDGPQDLGALAEDAREDGDLAGGGDGRAPDGVAQRLEQQVAGLGQLAADEDALGASRLQVPATTLPRARPASAITRRQPTSPAWAWRTTWRRVRRGAEAVLVAFDRVVAGPGRRATARLAFSAPAGSYKLVVGDLSRPIRVG
jgi:hypothetical protein